MNREHAHEQLIYMVGTDHGQAPVDVRAKLSLTAEARDAALPVVRATLGATGVVLLATCNRVELWASFDGVDAPERLVGDDGVPQPGDPMVEALCAAHNLDPDSYAHFFTARSGDDAVQHLFDVACGLRSAILAEDQIVSQVKQALATSRELGVADSCLEVLFRSAVTSAKQVKSGVRFTRAYGTAVEQAIDVIEERGMNVSQSKCLVIGNGEYGRLAARSLVERGAHVRVTVRQYTHGSVLVPHGCEGVPYADRYSFLNDCDIVMSATSSPHFTLEHEKVAAALGERGELAVIDLAVPRDVDPRVADVPGCTLLDIDSFTTQVGVENEHAIASARKILASGMDDFWNWVRRRNEHAGERPPATLFPLFVDLSATRVVFVGGGTVALRRIRTLLPFVDDIVVYAPEFSPELERFADDGAIQLVRRAYSASVLDGADMVLACTNDRALNDEIWAECKRRAVPVNVCSDRFKCDFQFPGVVQHDNLVVGVNAGGRDHRRVKQLRARIDRLMDEEDW